MIFLFRKERPSLRTYSRYHVFFPLSFLSSDIFSTTWSAILRDCIDPDTFCPQRYLNDDSLPDPFEVIFGFGRRLDQPFIFCFVLGSLI